MLHRNTFALAAVGASVATVLSFGVVIVGGLGPPAVDAAEEAVEGESPGGVVAGAYDAHDAAGEELDGPIVVEAGAGDYFVAEQLDAAVLVAALCRQ